MNHFNIAQNLVRLRHEKKITQEQLAYFLGVTKASVSKWETRQSLPDISLLPLIASFFDISIDELIGYYPQLSKEEIMQLYYEFSEDFANKPFDEVMDKINVHIKMYYSCYPFIFQICILLINYYMLAKDKPQQTEVLQQIIALCEHVQCDCKDMNICSNVVVLQAIANLQLGKAKEVIELLEDITKPYKLINHGGIYLTMAYMMLGNIEKAKSFTQLNLYYDILSLVGDAKQYLSISVDNFDVCNETVKRIDKVIKAFELKKLHPNDTAVFYYQAAICYCSNEDIQNALYYLNLYVDCLEELLKDEEIILHGDWYFDSIIESFKEFGVGLKAPRNRKVILEDVYCSLENPAFANLYKEVNYKEIKDRLKKFLSTTNFIK